MPKDNGYRCGNCDDPGDPLDKIPGADRLVEIPAACGNCVRTIAPEYLTTIICKSVKGVVLGPYRATIVAELERRRASQ